MLFVCTPAGGRTLDTLIKRQVRFDLKSTDRQNIGFSIWCICKTFVKHHRHFEDMHGMVMSRSGDAYLGRMILTAPSRCFR